MLFHSIQNSWSSWLYLHYLCTHLMFLTGLHMELILNMLMLFHSKLNSLLNWLYLHYLYTHSLYPTGLHWFVKIPKRFWVFIPIIMYLTKTMSFWSFSTVSEIRQGLSFIQVVHSKVEKSFFFNWNQMISNWEMTLSKVIFLDLTRIMVKLPSE